MPTTANKTRPAMHCFQGLFGSKTREQSAPLRTLLESSPPDQAPEHYAKGREVDSGNGCYLCAHELKYKVFVVPTWCDVCGGVLVGGGYECTGDCKLRCHAGLGKGVEHCRAELLLQPCVKGAQHKQGSYEVGDVAKQAFRDIHQAVKDVVVQEALKEQRSWGKFDMLKQHMCQIRKMWNRYLALTLVLAWQAITVAATAAVSFQIALYGPSSPFAPSLAHIQMTWSVVVLLVAELLLIVLCRALAAGTIRHSALVHTFVRDILRIDLGEVCIDLDSAAVEVLWVLDSALCFSCAVFVSAAIAYVQALQAL